MSPRLCRWPSVHPALPRRAAISRAACRQTPPPHSVPSAQAPREGTLVLWEVASRMHPPLPGFSSLLGHPLVTSPSHPRPRGLCGAPQRMCRGEMERGAGTRGFSPGQQTHCTVVGLSAEERVPATLTFDVKHHIVIPNAAEQCFHSQHCKSVCRAKPRSRWEPRPWLRGHARDGRTGVEHLLGLVGGQPSCWHPLQKVSTSSGICCVAKKIWESRARKMRGKSTFSPCVHPGSRRISCSTLVACRKQITQRQSSVPRCPHGRARAQEGEAQAPSWATGDAGGAPALAAPTPAPNPGFQPTA